VREIVVLSGKGGTGKTSFVAAFAKLTKEKIVLGDCDVDASNLALLMHGKDVTEEPFFAGQRARVDHGLCTLCGECVDVCRYGAMTLGETLEIDDLKCEGCHACSVVCPVDALSYVENRCGTLYERETEAGPLVHAALGIAQDNSGKLVSLVRERARALAETRKIQTVILDGPPGIGCPVHAALSGVSLVVAVTEPTPSGVHDLKRLLELCVHFSLKVVVVINKFDLNEESTTELKNIIENNGGRLIGHVPFDRNVPMALARGESPLAVPVVREAVERIWESIDSLK
jgi:MinD superfamily P-loop ATPase